MSTIATLVTRFTADTRGFNKGVSEVEGGITKTGGGIGGLARNMKTAIPVAAAAAGAGLFKMGLDFQSANQTLRKETGATGTSLDSLYGSLKNVYATRPDSLEDVTQAISTLNRQSGLTGKTLEDTARTSLRLAGVTKEDLGGVLKSTQALMNNWGVAAGDQIPKMDALYRVHQKTGIGVSELATAMTTQGTTLRQLGLSYEESAGLMGTLNKAGVSASQTQAGFTRVLVQAAKKGVPARDLLRDTFDTIRNAQTDTKATGEAVAVFGARAGPRLATLIREGQLSLDDLGKTIAGGKDTIDKAAADTATGAGRMKIAWHGLQVAVEPLATKLVTVFAEVAGKVLELSQALTGALGPAAPIVVGALLGVVGAMWLINNHPLVATLVVLVGIFTLVYNATGSLELGLFAVAGALAVVTVAMWALNGVPLVAVITAIIAAVVALVVGIIWLVKNWDKAWNAIKGVAEDVWNAIKGAWDTAWGAIKGGFEDVLKFLASLPGKILDGLKALPGLLLDTGKKLLKGLLDGAKWFFTNVFVDWILLMPIRILALVVTAAAWLVGTGIKLIKGLVEGIIKTAPQIWDWLKALPGRIWDLLKNAGRWLLDTGKKLLHGLRDGIVNGAEAVWEWLKALPGRIWNLVTNAPSWLLETGKKIVRGLKDGYVAAGVAMFQWFKDLPGKIWDLVKGAGKWLLDTGKDLIQGLIDGVVSMGGKLVDKVKDIAKKPIDAVKGIFDIFSPSKVFIEIGQMVGKGFIVGLTDSETSIDSTMNKLRTKISSAVTATARDVTSAQKGVETAQAALSKSLARQVEVAGTSNKKVASAQASLNKALQRQQDLARMAGSGQKRTAQQTLALSVQTRNAAQAVTAAKTNLASVQSDNARSIRDAAVNVADSRGKLSEAQKLLGAAVSSQTLAGNLSTTAKGLTAQQDQLKGIARQVETLAGKIKDASKAYQDALKEQQQAAAGFAGKYTSELKVTDFSFAEDYVEALDQQRRLTYEMRWQLEQLAKAGLDKAVLDQLASQGVGAIQIARSLQEADPEVIAEINKQQQNIARSAQQLGNQTAQYMYGAGVQAAKGLLQGLQSQKAALQTEMTALANSIVNQVKRTLKIKSPSEVTAQLGEEVTAGLAVGIASGLSAVESAASTMADAVTFDVPHFAGASDAAGGWADAVETAASDQASALDAAQAALRSFAVQQAGTWSNLASGTRRTVQSWATAVAATFTSLASQASATTTGLSTRLQATWTTLTAAIRTAVSSTVQTVNTSFQGWSERLRTITAGMADTIRTRWTDLSSAIRKTAADLAARTGTTWTDWNQKLRENTFQMQDKVRERWAEMASAVVTSATGMAADVRDQTYQMQSKVREHVFQMKDKVTENGKLMASNFAAAMTAMAQAALTGGSSTSSNLQTQLRGAGPPITKIVRDYARSLRDALNPILQGVGKDKIALPFATGGRVPGAGDRDTVPAMLTPGEFVIPKDAAARYDRRFLELLRQGAWMPTGYQAGGAVEAEKYAKSMVGKPYVWGAVGYNAADCSGLWSGIYAKAFGLPMQRYFTTHTFPNVPRTGRGRGPVQMGVNPSHMAGDFSGRAYEARGRAYPILGPGQASPATHGSFSAIYKMLGIAGGAGGAMGVDEPIKLKDVPKIEIGGDWYGATAKEAMAHVRKTAQKWVDDHTFVVEPVSGGDLGIVSEQVRGDLQSWIRQALEILNKPMSWIAPLARRAMIESTGAITAGLYRNPGPHLLNDPRVVNMWDSNARAGHPSMGIMQTIGPTFSSYKLPGYDNILNPVHNIIAAIRYIMAASYRTPFGLPSAGGYANGGIVPATAGGRHILAGEGGRDEAVIPLPSGWRQMFANGDGSLSPAGGQRTGPAVNIENYVVRENADHRRIFAMAAFEERARRI